MLTKRSLVFMSLARAGTDLDFKQKFLLSFGRSEVFVHTRIKNPPKLSARTNKTSTGVRILSASRDRPRI